MTKTILIIFCLSFSGCWLEHNTFVIWVNDTTLDVIHWAKAKIISENKKEMTKAIRRNPIKEIVFYSGDFKEKQTGLNDTLYSEPICLDSLPDSFTIRYVLDNK